jgi:hypothetical protein
MLLRVADDSEQRYAGLMLSALDTEWLTNEHDEDWFRNPRAAERLRAESELSPEVTTNAEALAQGALLLEKELLGALD